jgi:hypothetical protein
MNFLNLRIANMKKVVFDVINFINLPKVNAQQTEVKLVIGFSSIAIHYLPTLKSLNVTLQRKI